MLQDEPGEPADLPKTWYLVMNRTCHTHVDPSWGFSNDMGVRSVFSMFFIPIFCGDLK